MAKKAVKKTKKVVKKKVVAKKAAKKTTAKRKPNAKFMAPMQVSDTLAEVVGNKPIPRTEVTKKLGLISKRTTFKTLKKDATSTLMKSFALYSVEKKLFLCSR